MAFVGLRDIHYAEVIKDDSTGATYKAPKKLAGAIAANRNPNSSTGTLFADDGPMESAASLGEIELELNVADIPLPIQAELLGHSVDANGILVRKATDVAPYFAVGYRSLKSDGSYRYTWLLKGKFSVPESARETKTNDVNFQTQTIVGAFLKREFDDIWERELDSNQVGPNVAAVIGNWFKGVEPSTVAV